jgi:O-antigen ligase
MARVSFAVPFIVLSLPFYLQPRTFGGVQVSVTEVAIVLGSGAVLTRGLLERRGLAPGPPTVRLPEASAADWGAAGFLLAALLSLLVTEYPRQSMRELRWLIIEPVLVFYLVRATIADAREALVALWSIVGAGLLATVASLSALAANGTPLDPTARATYPYLSPNHLGLFLGRAATTALALALFAPGASSFRAWRRGAPAGATESRVAEAELRSGWPVEGSAARVRAWIALAILVLGLGRTLSVGAWVGFGAAALALAALLSRRAALTAGTALLGAAVLALVVLPAERTTARLDPETGTGLFRLQIWAASVHMVADHPLLGIGLDNYLYRYRGGYMLPEAWEEPDISHPHNWVLDFWLQLGFLGLLSAIALIAWSGVVSRRLLRRESPYDRTIGAVAIGLLVETLVHGAVDNSYFLVDAAVIWWMALGVLALRSSRIPEVTASGTSA